MRYHVECHSQIHGNCSDGFFPTMAKALEYIVDTYGEYDTVELDPWMVMLLPKEGEYFKSDLVNSISILFPENFLTDM